MRNSSRSSTRARPGRAGFALADVVVAVTLLGVGLLALAGVTAGLLRADRSARRDAHAARSIDARVSAATAGPCVAAAGTRVVAGASERWSVAAAGGVCRVADTVTWIEPGAGARVAGAEAVVGWTP